MASSQHRYPVGQILLALIFILAAVAYLIAILAVGILSMQSPNYIWKVDDAVLRHSAGDPALTSDITNPNVIVAAPPEIPPIWGEIIAFLGPGLSVAFGVVVGIELKGSEETNFEATQPDITVWQAIKTAVDQSARVSAAISKTVISSIREIWAVAYFIALVFGVVFFLVDGGAASGGQSAIAIPLQNIWKAALGVLVGGIASVVSKE